MKTLGKIAIGTALLMMVAAALPSAQANCGSPILLDTQGEALISNPAWCGTGLSGCYDSVSGPPISPNVKGVFWALGTGNPDCFTGDTGCVPGDDSGNFTGGLGPTDAWIKQVSLPFTNGLYHYPGFMTLKDGGNFSGNPVNWSLPVDGCVENAGVDACTCVLLTDEWNGVGYYALLGAKRSPNFDLTTGGDIRMFPIPDAVITGSATDSASAQVTVNVRADAPTGGNYAKDGCVCDAGFRVYGNIVTRGATPPTSRSAGWMPLSAVMPFGGTADALADCDPLLEQDLYVGVGISGANGTNAAFENLTVSGNSTRIPCGANLADPGRPGRGGKRGTDPRPDRGRDGDRRGGR